jgi:hypothetical protein
MNFHYFTAASKHTNQQMHSFYRTSLETKVLREVTAVNQKFTLLQLFRYTELQHTLVILTLLILTCNMYYVLSEDCDLSLSALS